MARTSRHGRQRFLSRPGDQRTVPIVLIVVALALVGARIASTLMQPPTPPQGEAVLVRWVGIDEAVQLARVSGKPLLLNFTADWCEPCHALDAEVFANPQIAAEINMRFIAVRVVDRKREEGQNVPVVDSLQSRYAVQGFPTLVFAEPDLTERARMEGFSGRAEFERVMESALR